MCNLKNIKGTRILYTKKNLFYNKILLPDENGCMVWIGSKRNQYGLIRINKKVISAHRYSYFLHYGEYDQKLEVCHSCDNPSCVSPIHLFLGTHKENMLDMSNKNRVVKGINHRSNKLSEDAVRIIKRRLSNGEQMKGIAKEYGVNPKSIFRIKHGINWKHIN